MYPYNRNTHLYTAKVQAKEEDAQTPPLSADRRLLELLALAQEATQSMACRYRTLMAEPALEGNADILKTMLLDEQKHSAQLRDVVFSIQGSTETEEAAPETPETQPAETEALLEETLLAEMDDISFFRDLLLSLPETELRDAFYEMVTDKQNHCSGLCYLYAKYFS